MASSWVAVFETVGGQAAGRRVTFDAEDWTFQAAEKAAADMADEENRRAIGPPLEPDDDEYMLVKLYTAEQLAALDGPEEPAEEQDWAQPILKALEGLRQAHNHNRRNAKALKILEAEIPKFLAEYQELTTLAKTMMAAWESLKESEQAEKPRESGLVLASTADIAAVRSRKGL